MKLLGQGGFVTQHGNSLLEMNVAEKKYRHQMNYLEYSFDPKKNGTNFGSEC